MNWPLIIGFLIFSVVWIGLALIVKSWGFGDEEEKLLKEYREKNSKFGK